MKCSKCGSENISIQIQEVGAKTKNKGNGLLGHINNAARDVTAACTLGLSNLVWRKSKGVEKTIIKNEKIAICQNCGNSWKI